uniref:Uncharacterized protein n=1 Tax=Bactrocera dorsalis TaxID=27457 RepID=A0A034WFK4_BACDO
MFLLRLSHLRSLRLLEWQWSWLLPPWHVVWHQVLRLWLKLLLWILKSRSTAQVQSSWLRAKQLSPGVAAKQKRVKYAEAPSSFNTRNKDNNKCKNNTRMSFS